MRSSKEVISEIKRLRELRGWSLDELSQRVGVAKSTLSRYESGQREFPINDIGKYANVFGVSVENLLGIKKPSLIILAFHFLARLCPSNPVLPRRIKAFRRFRLPVFARLKTCENGLKFCTLWAKCGQLIDCITM